MIPTVINKIIDFPILFAIIFILCLEKYIYIIEGENKIKLANKKIHGKNYKAQKINRFLFIELYTYFQ